MKQLSPQEIAEMEAMYGAIKPGPSTSLLSSLAQSNPRIAQALHATRGAVNSLMPGIALDYNFRPDVYNPFTGTGRRVDFNQDAKTTEGIGDLATTLASGGVKKAGIAAGRTLAGEQANAVEMLFKNKAWNALSPEMKADPEFLSAAANAFRTANEGRAIPKGLDIPRVVESSNLYTKGGFGKANKVLHSKPVEKGASMLSSLGGKYAENPLAAQGAAAPFFALGNIPAMAYDQVSAEAPMTPEQPVQVPPAAATPAFPQTSVQPAPTVTPEQVSAEAGVSPPQQPGQYLELARQLFPQLFAQEQAKAVNYQPATAPQAPTSMQAALPDFSPMPVPQTEGDYAPPAEHFLTRLGMVLSNVSRGLQGQELDFYGPQRQLEQLRAQRTARQGSQLGNQRATIENQFAPAAMQADVMNKRLGAVQSGMEVANYPERTALVNEAMRLQNAAMARSLTPLEQQRFELLKMLLGQNMQQDNIRLSQSYQPTPAQQFAASNPGVMTAPALEQVLRLPQGGIVPENLTRMLRTDPMAALELLQQMSSQTGGPALNVPQTK